MSPFRIISVVSIVISMSSGWFNATDAQVSDQTVDDKDAKTPKLSLHPFPLGDVVLHPNTDGNPSPFIQHRDKFLRTLAKTNPDRFLYVFRDAFGQKQPDGVEPMGVWDSQTTRLRGHATGHYLSALAQVCASTTYDPKLQAVFAQKLNHVVDTLDQLSKLSGTAAFEGGPFNADPVNIPPGPGKRDYDSDLSREGIRTDYWNWGEGFISGYPPDQFIMLEQGASYGEANDQVWAPHYTLHKILAGLIDCHQLADNPKALEVATGMGLWVYKRLIRLPSETRSRMWSSYIAGEYGGMNETMARLYRITGDRRFFECAKLFDNVDFFFGDADRRGGLVRNVDTIRGKHANQHIPQIIGALETYRVTQDDDYHRVVRNFWNQCREGCMYSIGGVAGARNPDNPELFTAEPNTLFQNGFSDQGQNETCATYNLLKLARSIFMHDPDARYMDYYERALYNHILASVAEHNAANTYHVPLNPGAVKTFTNANMTGFTCCNGTAMESATKLQNTIYMTDANASALFVNLYIASTLDWKARDVQITQETSFPFSENSKLTIAGTGNFFAKQLEFYGIPIKSSAAVDDRALHEAYDRLAMMLAHLPDARDQLAAKGAELHIIGRHEVTTDLPEFRAMKGVKIPEYGGLTYDERTRGMGGLLSSCGEENLLKLPEDRYRGSDICVHEFAHNVMDHGVGPKVTERFEAQRKRSLANGLWVDSYAGSNAQEFFAELAMWYFGSQGDRRMNGPAPAAGREGLKAYDPQAYELVDDFWSGRLKE